MQANIAKLIWDSRQSLEKKFVNHHKQVFQGFNNATDIFDCGQR